MKTWNDIEKARDERLAASTTCRETFATFESGIRAYLIETVGCPTERLDVALVRRDRDGEEECDLFVKVYFSEARDSKVTAYVRLRRLDDGRIGFHRIGDEQTQDFVFAAYDAVSDALLEMALRWVERTPAGGLRDDARASNEKTPAKRAGVFPVGRPIGDLIAEHSRADAE